MPLPRFRLRTLMIAVAVVALLVAIGPRRSRFLALAQYHQEQAGISVYYLEHDGSISLTYDRVGERRISPARFQWHRTLSMKYIQAAHYPWLPVLPDPPPPK